MFCMVEFSNEQKTNNKATQKEEKNHLLSMRVKDDIISPCKCYVYFWGAVLCADISFASSFAAEGLVIVRVAGVLGRIMRT